MPSAARAQEVASWRTRRQLADVAEEFRERRLALNLSQETLASAARVSRKHYGQIERGRVATLTVAEMNRIAAVLGLTSSVRLFPGGTPIRDRAHATKLAEIGAWVAPPLRYRIEVPLPASDGRWEQRAWDAMLFGAGARTAIELEMRLRDVQAVRRRIDLKRRDDTTEGFLLLVADTRLNRRVLVEFAPLFADLPRVRPGQVRASLQAGRLPPTGLLLV